VILPGLNAVELSNDSVFMLELRDNELVPTVLLERSVLEAIGGVFETRMLDEELNNVNAVELDGCKVEDVVASDTVLVKIGPIDTCGIFDRVLSFKVLVECIDDVDNVELDVFKIEDIVASNAMLVATSRGAVLDAIDRVLDPKMLDEGVNNVATVKLATVELVAEDEPRVLDKDIEEDPGAVELAEGVDLSLPPDEETTELLNSVGRSLLTDEEIEARVPEDRTVFTI